VANCKTEHGYERGPFDACTTQEDEGDEKVYVQTLPHKRSDQNSRPSTDGCPWLSQVDGHRSPWRRLSPLVERLGMAQPTHTSPQLMQKHLTIIKRSSQAPSRQLRVWRCLFL